MDKIKCELHWIILSLYIHIYIYIYIYIYTHIWEREREREKYEHPVTTEKSKREILTPFPLQKGDRWLGRLVSRANTIPQRHYPDALGEIANPLHHDPRYSVTLLLLCHPLYSRLRVRNFSYCPKQPFSRVSLG